jgi:pentatricopeptide repeat protein
MRRRHACCRPPERCCCCWQALQAKREHSGHRNLHRVLALTVAATLAGSSSAMQTMPVQVALRQPGRITAEPCWQGHAAGRLRGSNSVLTATTGDSVRSAEQLLVLKTSVDATATKPVTMASSAVAPAKKAAAAVKGCASLLTDAAPGTEAYARGHRSRVLYTALRKGSPSSALSALEELVTAGETVQAEVYDAVIGLCMKKGQWRTALRAFDYCRAAAAAEGWQPLKETYGVMLWGLDSAGQADAAVEVLLAAMAMPVAADGRPFVDPQQCNSVLDLCAECGRMGAAEEIMAAMSSYGVPPSLYTFCILLKGYGRQQQAHRVDDVLTAMQRARVAPDVVTLNAAIDAYVRCEDLKKAFGLLRAMESSAARGAPRAVCPNTRTYNTLIKGLGQAGRLQEAFEVLHSMQSAHCAPNSVTINSLIDACVRCGEMERAYELLKASSDSTSSSSSSSTTSSSSDNSGDSRASSPTSSSTGPGGRRRGRDAPSIEAYTAVLSGFAESGDKQRALGVFQLMSKAGVDATLYTYTALITACVNGGAMIDAKRVFAALEAQGVHNPALRPNAITYNTMITGLCKMDARDSRDQENAAYSSDYG